MTDDDPLSSLRSIRKVDPAFADRLESSMRIQHAAARPTPPGRLPWRQALLLGPAIVLVVLASAVLILRDEAQSSALELREAHGVVVTLPDGTSLIDPEGLELTDGYVVTVGPDGRAVIGDVELGPGSTVTVRDGVLVTADPATTTSTTPPDVTATDRSGASTTAAPVDPSGDGLYPITPVPDGDRVTDRGTDTAPPVATEPDRETTDASPDDASTSPTVTADPGDPVDDPEIGTVDDIHRIVDLALTVHVEDGAVAVAWRATGVGIDDLRIVLLRSHGPDAADPDWPLVGAVTIAAETIGSEAGQFRDDVPGSGLVVRYRAVALFDDDVVARSAIQTLALDR